MTRANLINSARTHHANGHKLRFKALCLVVGVCTRPNLRSRVSERTKVSL